MRLVEPLLAAALLLGGAELACRSTGFVQREYLPVHVGLTPVQADALRAMLRDEPVYLTFSPTLGWTVHPNARSSDGLYQSNAQGLRAEREYARTPPDDRIRITAFGESYVHGSEVAFPQTWEERLTAADGRFEVVNAGVPGTAIDHALLRYREMRTRLDSDIVVIGFMSENVNRLVSVFFPYYLPGNEMPLAKPRFELQGGQLAFVPSPLQTRADLGRLLAGDPATYAALGAHDYWYHIRPHEGVEDALYSVRLAKIGLYYGRRLLGADSFVGWNRNYRPESQAVEIAWDVLDVFYRDALAHGSMPLIVIFPAVWDLDRRPVPQPYAPLLDRLRQADRRVLDLADAFPGAPDQYGVTNAWLAHNSHYPAETNAAVGRWLAARLGAMGLTDRDTIRAAVREESRRLGDAPVVVTGLPPA
jgi:hypothetical protein